MHSSVNLLPRQGFLNIPKHQSSLDLLEHFPSLLKTHRTLKCISHIHRSNRISHISHISHINPFSQTRILSTAVRWNRARESHVELLISLLLHVKPLAAAMMADSATLEKQCTKDAQFIVVVARDATLPNIDLETISLLGEGQGCTHVDSNSHFAIYQFPVTSCGSVIMEEPGVIIYENRMSSSYEVGVGPLGAITRDSYYELLFQCRYIGTSVETVVVEVLPLQDPPLPVAALGPIRVALRLANGQCFTKGCNEVDVAYSSFYTEADYPVTKVLRDPVYVEVQLLERTDPMLVLTLGRCWTTISPNPHSLPQWDILIDGCPYRDDRYLSSLVPVDLSSGLDFPSHYRRFLFKMFTFVDPGSLTPMREQVYIHCSTAVCSPVAGGSCEPSCYRKSRKRRDAKAVDQKREEPKVVASVGPVIIGAPEEE
eukprot:superscaffoldBa00001954_g12646